MIEALVFDFDGLILETEEPCYQAWLEIYQAHGQHLPIEVWVDCIGRSADYFDPVLYLENRVGHSLDSEQLRSKQRRRYRELLDHSRLLPGVRDVIEAAGQADLKLAVASSSSSDWVVGHLTRLNIVDAFNSVQCWREGRLAKPHPDLYLSAVGALDVEPARAVAFEDSPNGILGAKRAGLLCVAVPNPMTRELDLGAADLRLPSLSAVSLADLLLQLETLRSRGDAA